MTETALVQYEEMCRAVAHAVTVDAAKEIVDKSIALRVYAQQIKNRKLEIDATEIRLRAEYRMGTLLWELKTTGKLAEKRRPRKHRQGTVFLAELGISRVLARGFIKLSGMQTNEFEKLLSGWRARCLGTEARITVPLRDVVRADQMNYDQRKRAGIKERRSDEWDPYRLGDRRRVADISVGSLKSLKRLLERDLVLLESLELVLPANSLSTDTIKDCVKAKRVAELYAAANRAIGHKQPLYAKDDKSGMAADNARGQ